MRRVASGLVVLALAGCSAAVEQPASTGGFPTTRALNSAEVTAPPPPSSPACPVEDGCAEEDETSTAGGGTCDTLPGARAAFDAAAFAGSPAQASTTDADAETLFSVVQAFVDECGYQAVIDMAAQYPEPLYGELRDHALLALGEITAVPAGMLCRDLAEIGFSAANAVDYWYVHDSPPEMDMDQNGTPCETVWPDAGDRVPAWY